MGVKNLYMKMTARQKFIVGICICLIFVSGISAVWVYTYSPNSLSGSVILSEDYLSFSDTFSVNQVDVTNSNFSKTENIEIVNSDGSALLTANIKINKSDVNDSCTDWVNDCSIDVNYLNQSLSDGDNLITAPSGTSKIYVDISCIQNSCPQSLNANVTITN